MSTPSDQPQQPHESGIYFSDVEHAGEMARLTKESRLLTKGWGGPFPPQIDLSTIHNVLDIACGPGEWVLHVAQHYPQMQVTGIDISEMMIHFAGSISTETPNAHFQVMDALHPLDFADSSFDLVNMRLIFNFMKNTAWPKLLRECYRILRPNGVALMTETEFSLSNSLAFEQMNTLFAQALYAAGQSFSPDGRHIGIIPMLGQLLADAGFKQQQHETQGADLSAGTQFHKDLYEDYRMLFHFARPFLLQIGVTTEEQFEQIYHQMLNDLDSTSFRAFGFSLRVWGYKPA